jgi:hypothetical protein
MMCACAVRAGVSAATGVAVRRYLSTGPPSLHARALARSLSTPSNADLSHLFEPTSVSAPHPLVEMPRGVCMLSPRPPTRTALGVRAVREHQDYRLVLMLMGRSLATSVLHSACWSREWIGLP